MKREFWYENFHGRTNFKWKENNKIKVEKES
jgi:hypothetical protein